MKKAFIFTLDALFAVSILAVFFVVYSFEMNVPKETYWLPEVGNTFMTSLDKNGVFYQIFSQSDASAQAMLSSYLDKLPKNVNADLTVKIYHGSSDAFTLSRTIHATRGTLSGTQETHIKRVFSDIPNVDLGLAELVISYG